ncbi:MAG: hypothetical protein ACW97A_04760 [Candidatus Thorarchaeota archaeon]
MRVPGVNSVLRYVVGGTLVLIVASQLLSSVSWAIIAWRLGNIAPVFSVVATAVFLMYITGRSKPETVQYVILNALAWAVTLYLVILVVLIALPQGLLLSMILGAATVSIVGVIRTPSEILERVTSFSKLVRGMKGIVNSVDKDIMSNIRVFVAREKTIDRIVKILRGHLLLLVSITKYVDIFGVFLKGDDSVRQARDIFAKNGLDFPSEATPLLAETLVKIPLLEEEYGLSLSDYLIVNNRDATERLLSQWPLRATLALTEDGLSMVIRAEDSEGMLGQAIPKGLEKKVIIERDKATIQSIIRGGKSP